MGGPCPGGPAKGFGFALDETDCRRPGGGGPAQDTGLEVLVAGDCIVDPK